MYNRMWGRKKTIPTSSFIGKLTWCEVCKKKRYDVEAVACLCVSFQTGAGKTYSMGTGFDVDMSPEDIGKSFERCCAFTVCSCLSWLVKEVWCHVNLCFVTWPCVSWKLTSRTALAIWFQVSTPNKILCLSTLLLWPSSCHGDLDDLVCSEFCPACIGTVPRSSHSWWCQNDGPRVMGASMSSAKAALPSP